MTPAAGAGRYRVALGFAAVVPLVALWQLLCWLFHIPPYLLPGPGQSAVALWTLIRQGVVGPELWITAWGAVLGLLIGACVGLVIAYLVSLSDAVMAAVAPLLVGSQVIPKVAVFPLLGMWFGFGMSSRVIIAATMAFFPVVINGLTAARNIDPDIRDVLRCMRAGRWQHLRWHLWPECAPFLFAGIRLASVQSLIGVLVAEYLSPNDGLGYLLLSYGDGFRTASLVGVLCAVAVLGAAMYAVVFPIEWVAGRLYALRAWPR